ncbi:hypothetical protein K435DRAFT_835939 [Dendrothele bispora CBS 962.96]|uniref:G-protein coupled receptors family 1 profile domain-containing protein n=1 Tax=Dendrothele bispora (strain CBS 962.96) TaxID=1314807 RepID=A0A4S8ML75_DENBC|nr:hypothetical protein K435DRAFT_835939 [Dendrothele bispora CBS 962.96]
MIPFKTEKPFVPLDVTEGDLVLGSIAFGWFFGFGLFVTINAVRETRRTSRKFSAYIIMIWLEILADIGFAIVSWGYLYKKFPPGLGVFCGVIACWIIQVQCLMLIITNRVCLLFSDPSSRFKLKLFTASIVTVISIGTAFVWIPAQMQINHHFIEVNHWSASPRILQFEALIDNDTTVGTVYRWDRFEKSVYLVLDAFLNAVFIRTVKKRLVDYGLTKYDKVVQFNQRIIILSIGMDIFLLCMTTLKNQFVYCQFHPITYIVKLQIEIMMSNLIVRVARATGIDAYHEPDYKNSSGHLPTVESFKLTTVHVQTQVYTHHSEEDESAAREIRVSAFTNDRPNSQISTSKDDAVANEIKYDSTLEV